MNEAGMTDVDGASFLGANNAGIDRYIEGSFENAWRMLATAVPKAWLTNRSFANYPVVSNIPIGIGHVILPDDFYLLVSFKMAGWQKPVFEASIEDERVSAIQSNRYTRGSTVRPAAVISNLHITEFDESVVEINATTPNDITYREAYTIFSHYLREGKYFYTDVSTSYKGTWVSGGPGGSNYNMFDLVYYAGYLWVSLGDDHSVIPSDETTAWKKLVETTAPVTGSIKQILKYYSLPAGVIHAIEDAIYVPSVTPLVDIDPDSTIDINQRIIEPLSYVTAGVVFTIFQKDQLAASLTEKGLLMIPGYRSVKNNNVTFKQ